jgi:lipoate-protein ligase A
VTGVGDAASFEPVAGVRARSRVSADAGWPVLLRETGGEPVPQSSATVNIALVYAPPRSEGDQGGSKPVISVCASRSAIC